MLEDFSHQCFKIFLNWVCKTRCYTAGQMLVYIAYLKQGTPIISYSVEHLAGWDFNELLKHHVLHLEDESIPSVEMKESCISSPDSQIDEPDCMYELFSQLVFLFVGKQFALEAWENIAPKLQEKASIIKQARNTPEVHPEQQQEEEEENAAADPWALQCYEEFVMPRFGDKDIGGCLDDFNEMMIQVRRCTLYRFIPLSSTSSSRCISSPNLTLTYWLHGDATVQFGFMTLFAAAFPGGAFFALLNNIYEMRSDGDALLNGFQRPPITRRVDIGAWGGVLAVISYLAVISNSFIIGFTSDAAFELLVDQDEVSSIDERYSRHELWAAVIVAEHLMLLGKLLVETSFTTVPNSVRR